MAILLPLSDATWRRFPIPLLLHHPKAPITQQPWKMDEKCSQNTNNKPWSTYGMVKWSNYFHSAAPPSRHSHFWSALYAIKSANNTETVIDEQRVFTENKQQITASLSKGYISFARRRYLAATSASGMHSHHRRALITGERCKIEANCP